MEKNIPKGVVTGSKVQEVFNLAKLKSFAIPAVNVIGSNSINTVLETASEILETKQLLYLEDLIQ